MGVVAVAVVVVVMIAHDGLSVHVTVFFRFPFLILSPNASCKFNSWTHGASDETKLGLRHKGSRVHSDRVCDGRTKCSEF